MNKKPRGKYFWVSASAVLIIVLFIISIPLRNFLSGRFMDNGNKFLAEKKYVSAVLEYNKAKILSNKYNPSEKIDAVRKAETNILVFEKVLGEEIKKEDTEKIALAKEMPEDEVAAVKDAKKMIEEGFYQQAIILLNTALEMDKNYKDAWLYLGVANSYGASDPEVSKEGREIYAERVEEAFKKVQELDPGNKYAEEFLKK